MSNKAKKVYLAGPMRGIPEFNFPAFFKAAEELHAQGYVVFNPAKNDQDQYGSDIASTNSSGDEEQATKEFGFSLREALHTDLEWLCLYADAIALLPGWRNSKGATAELATATALGLEVIYLYGSEVEVGVSSSSKAKTYDDGKAPLAQLPWAAITELAQVQAYGHKKYGDFNNYRKGMEISRNLSCALRHIRDYMEGHDKDHESGLNPLAHALCRLSFVIQNLQDGTAIDDRYKA